MKTNEEKEIEIMVGFIFGIGAVVAVMTGAFETGQNNPDASSVFDVKQNSVSDNYHVPETF